MTEGGNNGEGMKEPGKVVFGGLLDKFWGTRRRDPVRHEAETPKDRFIKDTTVLLNSVRRDLGFFEQYSNDPTSMLRLSEATTTEYVSLIDRLYPMQVDESTFESTYGVRALRPEEIGTNNDELYEGAAKIVRTKVDGWKSADESLKGDDKAWFDATRSVFFPWSARDRLIREGHTFLEAQSYASIIDLLDVSLEDAGLTQAHWDETKKRFFRIWYENRNDKTNYPYWGGSRSTSGKVYNGIRPSDLEPDLATKKDAHGHWVDDDTQKYVRENIDDIYKDGDDILPIEKLSKYSVAEYTVPQIRLGTLSTASTSPIWGRMLTDVVTS